jgi:hypothetical protein
LFDPLTDPRGLTPELTKAAAEKEQLFVITNRSGQLQLGQTPTALEQRLTGIPYSSVVREQIRPKAYTRR